MNAKISGLILFIALVGSVPAGADPCSGIVDQVLKDEGFAGVVPETRTDIPPLRNQFCMARSASLFDGLVRLDLSQPGMKDATPAMKIAAVVKRAKSAKDEITKQILAKRTRSCPPPVDGDDADAAAKYLRTDPKVTDPSMVRELSWFLEFPEPKLDADPKVDEVRSYRKTDSVSGIETEIVVGSALGKVTSIFARFHRPARLDHPAGPFESPYKKIEIDPKGAGCAITYYSADFVPKSGHPGPQFFASADTCPPVLALSPAQANIPKRLAATAFPGDSMLQDMAADDPAWAKAYFASEKATCREWLADFADPLAKLKPFKVKYGAKSRSGGNGGAARASSSGN